jgi:protein TonB
MGEGSGVRSLDLDDTLPLTSGRAKKEESLLDATWLSVPRPAKVERADIPLGEPVAELVSQGRAASASGSSWKWIAVAAVLAVALAAGGLWWRSGAASAPVQPARSQAPAPGTVPARIPARPAETAPVLEEVVPEPPESPSPTPAAQTAAPPPSRKPREVDLEDAVAAAEPVNPMNPGEMIRKGLPNVVVPEAKELPAFDYPAAAQGSGRKPVIRVRVLVDETGRVIEARISEGDDSGLGFNEAAQEAALKTPFFPATRDDIPGRMWTELIFEFIP